MDGCSSHDRDSDPGGAGHGEAVPAAEGQVGVAADEGVAVCDRDGEGREASEQLDGADFHA